MKVLLAIDTNKEIRNISKRLINFLDLYELKEAYLDIFHTYETPQIKDRLMVNLMTEVVQDERLKQIALLRSVENKIENTINEHSGIACLVNTILESGDFLLKIRSQLEKTQYDLLILVPSHKDRVSAFLRKNKVFSLIDSIEIPILILPKENEEENTTFNLIGLVKDELSLKHIRESSVFRIAKKDRKSVLHFGTKEMRGESITSINTTDPIKSFLEYHEASNTHNLYVANHKKHEGLNAVLRRSFTKKILNSGEFNLLII